MTQLSRLSACLLEFHEVSTRYSPDEFLGYALGRICDFMSVETAWWGVMSLQREEFRLHASWRVDLPSTFENMWEECKRDDALAQGVSLQPGRAVSLDEKGFRRHPGLATLMGEHGIRKALCSSAHFPEQDAFMFLSLYHRKNRFDGHHGEATRLLLPHFFSAWRTNLRLALRSPRCTANPSAFTAYVSRQGRVIEADPGFADRVAHYFPEFRGNYLPGPLLGRLGQNTARSPVWMDLGGTGFRVETVAGVLKIELLERSIHSHLTQREYAVGRLYASGLTYKQISKNLDISPATVRHHLRNLYIKLNVQDKGALATRLSVTAPLA